MRRFLTPIALVTISVMFGCEKDNKEVGQGTEPETEVETVTVSLGLGGEISVSESPLSRAAGSETSSNDLYGINVYYDEDDDGKIDDHYAYGLFDNVADMVITLVTGHKYKFECRMVVDGKTTCLYNSLNYSRPFCFSYSDYHACDNKFISSGSNFFIKLGFGNTYSSGYVADTYYGEITDYTPKAGGVVNINMKRCSYGLTVNLSGLSKGEATIDINTHAGIDEDLGVYVTLTYGYNKSFTLSTDGEVVSNVLSFDKTYECWLCAITSDDYTQTIPLRVNWSYTYDGTSVTESFTKYQAVTLKRNVMTTVNINLNIDTKGQENNSINLTRSETSMGSQTLDYNYIISLNGTVDNPVNP